MTSSQFRCLDEKEAGHQTTPLFSETKNWELRNHMDYRAALILEDALATWASPG